MALASLVDSPISIQVPQNAISSAMGPELNLTATTGAFALGHGRAATNIDPLGASGENSGLVYVAGAVAVVLIMAVLAGRK